jgi:hypothetical protein
MRMLKAVTWALAAGGLAANGFGANAVEIRTTRGAGDFALAAEGKAAEVYVDAGDYTVVRIAAGLLADDVERVTGFKSHVRRSNDKLSEPQGPTVFLGTLGHSPTVDALVKAGGIDVSKIQGKWESYVIAPVEKGLVVVGSDRRGTAYGALELSRAMGVSPWVWWADVPAPHKDALYVMGMSKGSEVVHGEPSVKYRGIFINDEDWGMQPWAAKTVEPKSAGGVGDIGPKTYAHIFELLLRLNANFCWPAMHPCTQAFNIYPENKQVADDYAIVMGSSHCEPMLRNNVTEWGQAKAASYNYFTNPDGVLAYWKQRVQENGKFENVYTLGMRGIHDSDMAGGGTPDVRAKMLNRIMGDQRGLLKELVNPDVTKVPQIFCPYKEVLTLYQKGAVPPEDVTLVWADDNHGYIRQLSTPEEQKRSGGAGVYYHLSYWGRPHDFLWLSTIPPALVWEELSKAYDYGARNLWVVNVGDLKPAEIDLTLATRMGYDMERYTLENQGGFLKEFAEETFGKEHAEEIAAIMDRYYHLNYQRKPEHMGFNTSQNPGGPIQPTEFSDAELHGRIIAFAKLEQETDALYEKIPASQRDAFYELVAYPVRGSAEMNFKLLFADMNRRGTAGNATEDQKAWASYAAAHAREAYEKIEKETAYYNDTLAGGKWKYIMSSSPHKVDVFRMPAVSASANAPDRGDLHAKFRDFSSADGTAMRGFEEREKYLSIPVENATRNTPRSGAAWKVIKGLGRLGDSMAVFPTTTPSQPDSFTENSPSLEYDFVTTTDAPGAKVTLQAIPTHRINPERGLRYAIGVDDEKPQVIDLETPEFSATWSTNVLRGSAFGVTTHKIGPGKHVLHLYMVDPGVVADHLTIDLGGLPKGYLPPAETVAK